MSVFDSVSGLPLGEAVSTLPATRPSRTTISGQYVSLGPLMPARDAGALFEETCGEDKEHLWTYMSEGPFPDRNSFDSFLCRKSGEEDPLYFSILNKEGTAVGFLSLMRIEPAHRVIEVGNIMFGVSLQRTPGGTEAIYLVAGHVFNDLGFRRLEWKCNSLNEPSRRAALRYGFTFEGIFRKHLIVKGRNRDTAWYSILDSEWHSRRQAFDLWLNPGNFDGDGNQRETLASIRESGR